MKKLLFIFMVAILAVSCTDEPASVQWKVIDLQVPQNKWVLNKDADGLNNYYSCHFTMPEITSIVYNSGTILTYIVLDNTQQTLPYVRHFENTAGNLWTRTVDCDFGVGGMNIYVTNSDFFDENPGTMNFRVVLMY